MAKKKDNTQINLLPQEEFKASTLGRTLQWMLTTFRYIIIVTEMVVMVAFLSRFWLDAKSADLIDSINQKKAIIASYKTFEESFRSIQNKLKIFNSFANSNQTFSPILETVSSKVPNDVVITEININGPKAVITLQTQDEAAVSSFVSSLNSSNIITNANITSVQSKSGDKNTTFTISATIQGENQNG